VLHKNKKLAGRVVVATLLALAGWFIPKPGLTAPLEVYGRLPSLENVALSPDGTLLALVHTTANDRTLEVSSVTEHKVIGRTLQIGNAKLRSIEWADNNHLLIFSSVTAMPKELVGRAYEWYRMTVWDVAKQQLGSYPRVERFSGVMVMNTLRGRVMVRHIEGHTILFAPGTYVAHMTLPGLFRIDLDTGDQRLIRQGAMETEDWLVDDAGEVVAEADYNQTLQHWAMLGRRDGRLQELASGHEAIDIPSLLGFGSDPGTLLVQTTQNGSQIWRLLSLQDGTFGPAMAERRSMEAPIEDRQTYRMIGGVHVDDSVHYVFFDQHIRGLWSSIVDAYGDEQVEFVSASADFSKVIVRVNGPVHGYTYNLMDLKTFKAIPIGEVYEGVGTPLEVKRIDYEAADGLKIPAYLTLPRGKPAKNLPLIVLPHGGPAVRDNAEFNWWAQALAAQGYLVLQPNYRGSAVTTQLLRAGYGEWGRKMQTDLSDGVRYLVKEGMADPARVCIVGGSYGGYAALAGVTLDPGVYRCAVSVAGVSDLKRLLQAVNPFDDLDRRYWDRFMGVTGPSDPLLQQLSPIKHVDAITAAVLLIHGRDDSVVRFEQSDVMLDAMKHAKKDVEMVTLKNEDHWLSRGETRLQMLQTSVAFLRAHNPPD
jgi:dipeptidyl aminopeptidase/acylaminoacyl peptidase